MYEKGELNRKGGEGAEYKTIVITATVQWAEGDAGKLWYLMHFTATCSPSGLTNAIAKQPLSHNTDERPEVLTWWNPKKMSMTSILLQNLLIGLEKQRKAKDTHEKDKYLSSPWEPLVSSARSWSGPAETDWQKMWEKQKVGACLPRNARNDSTVFRNSPPRFFDSNYALGLIS